MTLALILTEFAELVGDAIVNTDLGVDSNGDAIPAPTIERTLRYHGHAPPEDLECGRVLAVWWESPGLLPTDPGKCSAPLTVQLAAKYATCWKPAKVRANSTILLYDDQWDADAAILAEIAEHVTRRLVPLGCKERGDIFDPPDPFATALMTHLRQPRFVGASTTGASGTAAGIIWRVSGGIIPATPTS